MTLKVGNNPCNVIKKINRVKRRGEHLNNKDNV